MSAIIIDGKAVAAGIKKHIAWQVADRLQRKLPAPGLAVILVGNNPASLSYVRNKEAACAEVGILSHCHRLDANCTEQDILQVIQNCNEDPTIHGILLQLPLPSHIDPANLLEHISPAKDVDGFHPYNMGRLAERHPLLRPCTPHGVMKLLASLGEDLTGKHAVVLGASNIVGRPMALELLLAKCTVTICHRFTKNLASYIETADILISAMGKTGIIHSEWIKTGAIVIDVGFNRLPDGKITGDIDFESACQRAGWITPVPGGVGQMTVAMLLENTLIAAQKLEDGLSNSAMCIVKG
jgi:methylenetetrahydrofolate dehydrogenase (NADP+)/methenyltetrahydrofolate cyclohydrolase